MTTVSLELSNQDANAMPSALIGAFGSGSNTPHIADKLCSDLEWPQIEQYLEAHRIPYKVANPTGSLLIERNGADW